MSNSETDHDATPLSSIVDEASYANAIRRNYGRVYLTALAMVRQTEMAEDLTQETFLRAWLRRDTVDQQTVALEPWLLRIVRNLAVDWLRRGQSRSRVLPLISLEEITVEPADTGKTDPRQAASQTETQGQLAAAVMALPETMRQAVLLHYAEGITASEIARINGEAPSSVTRRLDKARQLLRQSLTAGATGNLADGLKAMRPREQSLRRTLGFIAAAATLPAATQAQLLKAVSNTPAPLLPDTITPDAIATHPKETGIMKSFIAQMGATKILVGALTATALAGGILTVNTLTGGELAAKLERLPQSAARLSTDLTRNDGAATSRRSLSADAVGSASRTRPQKKQARNRNSTARSGNQNARLPAATDSATSTADNIVGYVTVLGKVLDMETSKPLTGAIVRVSAPSKDMRSLKKHEDAAILQSTLTDAAGNFEMEVPLPDGAATFAIDAMVPHYQSVSGTMMSGGDFSKQYISAEPGETVDLSLELQPSRYVAGVVVNETGEPLPGVDILGTIHEDTDHSMAFIAETSTDPTGRFALYDFPTSLTSYQMHSGKLTFKSPDNMTTTIENIYAIPDDDVSRLRVVMGRGIDIRGQLLLASGQPASGLQLNIKFPGNSQDHSRHVTTDAGGYFHLQGLPEGRAVLFSSTPDLQERVTEEITVPVASDMTLRMTSMAYIDTSAAVTLFGMKLIDVTAELKKHYDLHFADGVLVLEAGPRIKSLFPGVEEAHGPQVGDQFFMAADKRITNVEEFARELLLAVNAAIMVRMADDTADTSQPVDVRVAYIFQESRETGTNTWHMRLTPEDVAELRAFVAQLHDD